jgi:hypothetical protein
MGFLLAGILVSGKKAGEDNPPKSKSSAEPGISV